MRRRNYRKGLRLNQLNFTVPVVNKMVFVLLDELVCDDYFSACVPVGNALTVRAAHAHGAARLRCVIVYLHLPIDRV